MKAPVIILGLICAALAFGLYKRNSSAGAEAEQALKQYETMSNQVSELRTKLALEQGTAAQHSSNANYAVTKRTSDLLQLSNRLVQTALLLKAAETSAREANANLQSKAAQIALLESERTELQHQLETIPELRRQVTEASGKSTPIATERDALAQENRRLVLEVADYFRKLNDPSFLKLQLERAEQDMETRVRLAKAGASVTIDKKSRLELQPDGTVRAVVAPKAN